MGGAQHEERVFVGARSTGDAGAIAEGHVKSVEDAFARAKDAAATLEKIEIQRNKQNAVQNRAMPMPSPPAATPAAMTAAPKRAAADEDKAMSPAQMREQHDRAIRNFQAY